MLDTQTPAQQLHFSDIVRKLALPCALFSAVLALLLYASWMLLLPSFTTVDLAGSVKDSSDLVRYRAELTNSISTLQNTRDDFLFPLEGTDYATFVEQKVHATKFHFLLQQIELTAEELDDGDTEVVTIERYRYDRKLSKATVEGKVHNVGPQSMTVQAQFIEMLRNLPGVTGASSSRFTRKEDPETGFYSPFVIELLLE